ncbi:MAG: homoserine kinase [Tissierellia bacterium]|nr:homoserine kinase [Tissierellia bacterium]
MKIRVPASTANIGPGFDTVGIALNLYNYFELKESEENATLADKAFNYFYKYIGKEKPKKSVSIIKSDIPQSRGLGSSANLIIGGLVCANVFEKNILSDEELLNLACKVEGHPDNVAPALLGGMVISTMKNESCFYNRFELSEDIKFIALIPDYELSTKKAREVLPKEISRNEAVENISNTAMLISSLIQNKYEGLEMFLKDNIHQPYRKKLIKDYDLIMSLIEENNFYGGYISGAGPTIMAIASNESPMTDNFLVVLNRMNLKKLKMNVDNEGYKIL